MLHLFLFVTSDMPVDKLVSYMYRAAYFELLDISAICHDLSKLSTPSSVSFSFI